MKYYSFYRKSVIFSRTILLISILLIGCRRNPGFSESDEKNDIQHEIVFYEDGRFAAWPANGGMWTWGDEILVCFTMADHNDVSGHTYDVFTSRNMLARSLDGGISWSIEDAYKQGITGYAMDQRIGDNAAAPRDLENPMDFHNPNFALLFQRETNNSGPTHFYYTYDRGKSWNGPFKFPDLDPAGITNRTDYIIDGKHELLTFLSIGHGRTGVARTNDGGLNWELISYIGPDFTRSVEISGRNEYSLMSSTVRLSPSKILTTIRHREGEPGRVWITSYLSIDNALTWKKLDDPVSESVNSPPALIQLADGRLVLVYIFRRNLGDGSSVCLRISSDEGQSWGDEIVLREKEGANWDVGYPRVIKRPDGKLVITYYWNHSLLEDKPPYRHIAVTIWDPEN